MYLRVKSQKEKGKRDRRGERDEKRKEEEKQRRMDKIKKKREENISIQQY